MSFRAFAAILICKLSRFMCRVLRRGGTSLPGKLAMRICPELLGILSKNVKIIAVTGTNGKTTSSRMIEQAFISQCKSYFANRSGANLTAGITAEFVSNSTLTGKCRKEYAIVECDEAASRIAFPLMKPRIIVVTNLFRDQLDRYGEVTHTLTNIRDGIRLVPEATLCLNADCSLTSSLAGDLPNRVVFFGINEGAVRSAEEPEHSDASHCIRCKTEYEYNFRSYGHLGAFRCPSCGYKREEPDYAVTSADVQQLNGSSITINIKGVQHKAFVNLPAIYNINNAAGAIAAICEAGLDVETALSAVASFKRGFGRMEDFKLGGGAKMVLIKNPAGCDQVLNFLSCMEKRFMLVICLNDRQADGTDVSWIWDAHFEKLAQMHERIYRVIISGDRAWDMATRIKYAGVAPELIEVERDYDKLVQSMEKLNMPVVIMPTYTAMLELRDKLIKHCGGDKFWV